MNEFKSLDMNIIGKVPIEQIVALYKEGYRINESIKSLATCPTSIVQGTIKPITISPSSGTPPYKLQFLVDGNIVKQFTDVTTAQTFNYTFNESVGSHTYQSRVIDSCGSAPQVVLEPSCAINITSPSVTPKYKCINGVCTRDDTNGTFTESSCNNTCAPSVTPKYRCINGVCTRDDVYGTFTEPSCGGTCLLPPPSECINCDKTKNICIMGNCIPKTYIFAGVGLVVLLAVLK